MLDNFFKLNGSPEFIEKQDDFTSIVFSKDRIENIVYMPDELKPKDHPRLKFSNKTFFNVSFAKTELKNLDFSYCHFEECLFTGTKINNCDFQNSTFLNSNTHKIVIKKTYVNPASFIENISEYQKSNIAVHLFQQLMNNSRDEEQSSQARVAEYNFRKWKNRLAWSKYKHKKPYPINFWDFIKEYIPSFIYRWTFGYGLRLRNFVGTFFVTFIIFFSINYSQWNNYKLIQKDLAIEAFDKDTVNITSNLFYTLDATTKLVDSQFQPSSDFGMNWLVIQGIAGFILLSALITILINRFVK